MRLTVGGPGDDPLLATRGRVPPARVFWCDHFGYILVARRIGFDHIRLGQDLAIDDETRGMTRAEKEAVRAGGDREGRLGMECKRV